MMRKRLVSLITYVSLVMILAWLPFIAVCSEAASAPSDTQTLKIGCSLPLNVALGVETQKCLGLIVDDFNKSGGLVVKGQRYNIDMIIYDDKYKPELGKAATERLLYEDKVKFLVSQLGSPPILGALTITEPAKVLNFFGGVSETLKDPKFKYALGGSGLGTFMMWPFVAENYPQAKKMVFVTVDDETGHYNARMNERAAMSYGIQTVREIFVPFGTQDFTPIANSVAALKPDVVCAAGTRGGADTGLLLKALRQSGWDGPLVHNVFSEPDVIAVCGKKATEGYIALFSDSTQWPNPPALALKLRKLYEAKYGSWHTAGISWSNPFYLFVAAVQKADSLEANDILTAISKGITYDTLYGITRLVKRPDLGNNRYVEALPSQAVGRYENGKMVFKMLFSPEQEVAIIERILGHPGEWQ